MKTASCGCENYNLHDWNEMIAVHAILLSQLKSSKFYPLTRTNTVELARSLSANRNDIRIVITADDGNDELGPK